jgi:azurin
MKILRLLIIGLFIAWLPAGEVPVKHIPIDVRAAETVLFYGNSLIERLLEHGECEALIQLATPRRGALSMTGPNGTFFMGGMPPGGVKIRSLAWTGDEVGYRLRPEGYVEHLRSLLKAWPAQLVVVGFGMNESFAGVAGLPEFRTHYQAFIHELRRQHERARLVLLSPIAVADGPDRDTRNRDLAAYSATIGELAAANQAGWIDLFSATQRAFTEAGGPYTRHQQPTDAGLRVIARIIAEALTGPQVREVPAQRVAEVALAAAQKSRFVADLVRPKNGVVYYGVRKRPEENQAEIPRYHQLIEQADAIIERLVTDRALRFADVPRPTLPPLDAGASKPDRFGGGAIRTPAEHQTEFTVAPGYAVSCFASEVEFPALRNPVQMAFDARGRLWVTTMPSFPHTIPGERPNDQILILDDRDHDGKADTCTVFADGFDALDGVAFHERGVVVSAQPRLLLLRDSDGDDRADVQEELLRGVDVTDSHHGGMIQVDQLGHVLFSDGVFHRSQLETPFGVVRGIDSTTYRLELASGRIEQEWQSLTPNPWKIAFDRRGSILQRFGGGQTLDGMRLSWTPLGVPHAYGDGTVLGDNKGCAATVVSSANFPDAFQQGLISAGLLGRYNVTMAALGCTSGPLVAQDKLDLLSSKNAAFRPVDAEFGFDGALYIADFCSLIIGHAQHAMRDPQWDHDHGRIWRVVHTGKPVVTTWPDIVGADVPGLLALLAHPQDQVRNHVRLRLRALGPSVVPALDAWIAARSRTAVDFPQNALEVLRVLHAYGEVRPSLLKELLQATDAQDRAAAVMLIRFQAGRLADAHDLLAAAAKDPHPRVRMAVINVISHLRLSDPHCVHAIEDMPASEPAVRGMLDDLKSGTAPKRGRSVPVLTVAGEATVKTWQLVTSVDGKDQSAYVTAQDKQNAAAKLPKTDTWRTIIEAKQAGEVLLSVRHGYLDINVNEVPVLSSDSPYSSDQQVPLTLKAGLNTITIAYRRLKGKPPTVAIHDALGQALRDVRFASDDADLAALTARWQQSQTNPDGTLIIRTVPNVMQFAPKELRVKAGQPLRITLENPDLMAHNLVLCAPDSGDEIGALADQMATLPDGMAKQFVPASPKVLGAIQLLNPGASGTLTLSTPLKPGIYPYLCTFPGHWRIMRGVLIVE